VKDMKHVKQKSILSFRMMRPPIMVPAIGLHSVVQDVLQYTLASRAELHQIICEISLLGAINRMGLGTHDEPVKHCRWERALLNGCLLTTSSASSALRTTKWAWREALRCTERYTT
jgi:hypothetical protein